MEESTYLSKHVSNEPIHWLDMISSGDKTYEIRSIIKIQEWNLAVGQNIEFYSGTNRVTCRITELLQFDSVSAAFNKLGASMVPINDITAERVVELYKAIPDLDLSDGVVAIGLKVILIRR